MLSFFLFFVILFLGLVFVNGDTGGKRPDGRWTKSGQSKKVRVDPSIVVGALCGVTGARWNNKVAIVGNKGRFSCVCCCCYTHPSPPTVCVCVCVPHPQTSLAGYKHTQTVMLYGNSLFSYTRPARLFRMSNWTLVSNSSSGSFCVRNPKYKHVSPGRRSITREKPKNKDGITE